MSTLTPPRVSNPAQARVPNQLTTGNRPAGHARKRAVFVLVTVSALLVVLTSSYAAASGQRHAGGKKTHDESGAQIHLSERENGGSASGNGASNPVAPNPAAPKPTGAPRPSANTTPVDPNEAYCNQLSAGRTGADYTSYMASCMSMMQNSIGTPQLAPVTTSAGPTPTEIREARVRELSHTVPMPKPRPKMNAPSGVCGVAHQLNMQIPAHYATAVHETDLGTLNLRARGEFIVDWGDGTKDRYVTTGGEWPNSEISHVWENRGTYTITVTATWMAHWDLDEFSGEIPGLRTVGVIPNWRVVEAQAVLVA